MSASQTRVRRLVYAAAWLPCLTVYMVALLVNRIPLGYAVRGAIAGVLPEALIGVAVLTLPRRLPWTDDRRLRFFAIQAAMLLAFVIASTAGFAALIGLDALLFKGAFLVRVDPRLLPWRILNDLLMYCALAGVAYALHSAASSREQAARAARAETLRAQAALQAMRSQLNPHFILNTFHALVGLVRRDPPLAEEALERLGDLLRYSLRIQRENVDEVTLRDEWSFVQSYLDLERLRLGDRLQVSFEAATPTLDSIVPSFALQTLVENAVRHAIAPRAEGGHLVVSAQHVAGHLQIKVTDDGRPDSAQSRGEGNGLGLALLQERLAALYGGQARLELHRAADGACAILDVPGRYALEDA
jgi:two-component system LytT family sensor kinase